MLTPAIVPNAGRSSIANPGDNSAGINAPIPGLGGLTYSQALDTYLRLRVSRDIPPAAPGSIPSTPVVSAPAPGPNDPAVRPGNVGGAMPAWSKVVLMGGLALLALAFVVWFISKL